ncbi:hypothetical protein FUA23_14680 [Neolewinella aurantiaca]|uniref:Uncharacterized protein n=1 Tax=Neolewinella aurantiaca TaxID=2602767 RepID=A0A5C7FQR3_9BACT|nr:hypothetical protein [Neolewinella aurantiaca]TXF88381.1 hypothetical protein FUA23_14680 [Neolewinella aurantiaca]
MRYTFLLLIFALFASCNVFKSGNSTETAAIQAPPTGLEGPAYDPSTSPQPVSMAPPMTTSPQPIQAGTQVQRSVPAGTDQPQAYGSVPMNPQQTGKGTDVAPSTYSAPAAAQAAPQAYNSTAAAPSTYAAPAPNTAEAALAEVLNGAWVNSTDSDEIVAFTPDHYQTYYRGELLVEEDMTYHAACPGDCNGGEPMEIACFTISGPAGTDCYGIIRLTPEVLELSLLGISTEPIVYYKQQ